MKVDFNIEALSVFGTSLPVSTDVFEEYEDFLPASLKTAALIRQQEYIAGRFCAVQAAKNIGLALTDLPSAPTRDPQWPSDMIGSISHSKKLAISCVARPGEFHSLGIDAEEILKKDLGIENTIANERELSLIRSNYQLGLTVIFSAKEALYKALYPKVRCFIDFKEVELSKIDLEKGKFELHLISQNPDLSSYKMKYQGSFQLHENTVISLITIPAQTEGHHVYS